jgi:hypothetical protein
MPRTTTAASGSSAFGQVQKQARQILDTVRKEIRTRESELERLRKEESQLAAIAGDRGAAARNGSTHPGGGTGKRTNWGEVLEQLPKQFKAAEVRNVRGLSGKRSSEIFAAITRWIDAGSVKKKERGLYERVK